jgi:putative PIN family toxin of toxin-antitoxin system
MIRVVLDANLYVSAMLKPRSKPARILQLVYDRQLQLLLSSKILSEINTVLLYPKLQRLHQRTYEEVDDLLRKLAKIAVLTPGKLTLDAVQSDPTDNKYVECAMEGEADFIVSGAHHLTDLKVFRGIRILSPTAFLNTLQKKRVQ